MFPYFSKMQWCRFWKSFFYVKIGINSQLIYYCKTKLLRDKINFLRFIRANTHAGGRISVSANLLSVLWKYMCLFAALDRLLSSGTKRFSRPNSWTKIQPILARKSSRQVWTLRDRNHGLFRLLIITAAGLAIKVEARRSGELLSTEFLASSRRWCSNSTITMIYSAIIICLAGRKNAYPHHPW